MLFASLSAGFSQSLTPVKPGPIWTLWCPICKQYFTQWLFRYASTSAIDIVQSLSHLLGLQQITNISEWYQMSNVKFHMLMLMLMLMLWLLAVTPGVTHVVAYHRFSDGNFSIASCPLSVHCLRSLNLDSLALILSKGKEGGFVL